ncbi:hypothetical protein Gotri_003034 [Gossypium trilobum]|uniref:Uncharacterized protein n=1 Tax=Gossypium trilobum TaxID=34281 RepID=A0A7J9FB35_9ROSI|nr:hypothetical protein [Gossypium trilobum]
MTMKKMILFYTLITCSQCHLQ